MTRRQDSTLRRRVNAVVAELRARRIDIKQAAHRILYAGAPFDVTVRVIAANTSIYG